MSRAPTSCLLLAAALCGAAASLPGSARADNPQEQQLAQALFDEGRLLMDKKRYGEACPKLAESQRLDPGGGTLLNLAICHEKEGKLATAKVDYEEALATATRDGRNDRQLIARDRLARIEGIIPRISVLVASTSETAGLEVRLDGLVLRRAAWGVATQVDPGVHVVEASAPGHATWSTQITIEASQKKSVDVPVLGPLSTLPGGGGLVGGLVLPAPITTAQVEVQRPMIVDEGATPPALPAYTGHPGHANPLFYTALGLTLAAGATSMVTGALAFSAKADAKAGCLPDRQYCRDQASTDAADRASTMAWISTVTLGLTAVGAIGMIALPRRTGGDRTTVQASVLPGGGSLGLTGAF